MRRRNKKNRFEFLTKKFPKRMQKKLVMLFMAIILAFIVLVGRITYINSSKGSKYTKIVLDQQQYDNRVVPFKRGDIVDRNGTKIATSERVYNVILDVNLMKSDKKYAEPTIEALKVYFEIKEADVRALIKEKPNSRYEILAKGIPYEKAKEFKAMENNEKKNQNIKGIWLEDDYKRAYPYNTLASDVIGFAVSGNQGAIGIESAYNSILNGTDGRKYGYIDSKSTVEGTVKPPKNGNTVVSTIDITLQSIVEQSIKEFNDTYGGQGRPGSKNTGVVIMNPNTGEILAEASYPNFDLNNPRDLSALYTEEQVKGMSEDDKLKAMNDLWRNFSISDAFEPGSTAKPFTVAAGLESGVLKGDEAYNCTGSLHVGGYDIHCHLHSGHGMQTIEQAIANSCNVALMEMGAVIGVKNFVRYQSVFGFGKYTGIDLPGEASTAPLVYTEDTMGITDLATNSFGQGFNGTMTQLSAAFSSLVNGGYYYEPHVVKQIQEQGGSVIETKDPVLMRKTVSAETSSMLKQYMKTTMVSGTGVGAAVEGFDIGGKTGTAEKLPRNQGKYLLSFIGYAPQDNPQVVVYVVIDEPNVADQSLSSYVLGLSKKIMERAFPYLEISTIEGYTASTEGATQDIIPPPQTQYGDFDASYEDTYDNVDGDYIDENHNPDLDDWATGQP